MQWNDRIRAMRPIKGNFEKCLISTRVRYCDSRARHSFAQALRCHAVTIMPVFSCDAAKSICASFTTSRSRARQRRGWGSRRRQRVSALSIPRTQYRMHC